MLTQSGYQLGLDDDLLIPASPLLGCRDLGVDETVDVGVGTGWMGFGVGPTLVLVRIQTEGRFPKLDELLPAA